MGLPLADVRPTDTITPERCSLLYLGALGGKRGQILKQIYQQFLDRGKAKKVALMAYARRILVWAWAIFCANSPFDPLRFAKTVQLAS